MQRKGSSATSALDTWPWGFVLSNFSPARRHSQGPGSRVLQMGLSVVEVLLATGLGLIQGQGRFRV